MTHPSGRWSSSEVAGHAADVFEPPSGEPHQAAVIFLHDADGDSLPGDDVLTAELAKHRLPCVCPRGGTSWWLDCLDPDFDDVLSPLSYLRQDVVAWIALRWNIQPPRIGLLGIGTGGQGALQLAYRHARQFPVVAAVSPAVDFHRLHGQGGPLDELFESAESARQQTVTLHLHPLNWPPHQLFVCDPADGLWYDGCERLASKLSSIGIPFGSDLHTSTGGHRREYFHAMAPRCVGFVAEHITTQSPAATAGERQTPE